MAAPFLDEDDAPSATQRRLCSALASVRSKERECATLRRFAYDASTAWQNAEADLVRLRLIIESLDDGHDAEDGTGEFALPVTTPGACDDGVRPAA